MDLILVIKYFKLKIENKKNIKIISLYKDKEKNIKEIGENHNTIVNKYEELIKKYDNIISIQREQNIMLTTALTIESYLKVINDIGSEDKSYIYNRLYFWGVPKDILNDSEKLIEFGQKCLCQKIKIEKGKPPFAFKFIEN